jgi:ectoine hydroxylase-related dioxygenase (phytanoyl-CoA dioxygenase family)
MNKRDFFQEKGYVVAENLIPDDVIQTYRRYWMDHHAPQYDGTVASMKNKMGWKESNPFINHKIILEILCHDNVYELFDEVGLEKMGLHLSFTPWYSTEKTWHQDFIKNDTLSAKNYVGLWIALQDVDPDSGPFAFVPGSNNWNFNFSIYENPNLQQAATHIHNEVSSNGQSQVFLPKKSGAILWQGHTIHRGLSPVNTNTPRECIIGHYVSGMNGSGSDQITMFNKHKNGFYIKHHNQLNDLYLTY